MTRYPTICSMLTAPDGAARSPELPNQVDTYAAGNIGESELAKGIQIPMLCTLSYGRRG